MIPLKSVADLGCPKGVKPDLQGWHSTDPFFAKIIGEVEPAVIVEVGSWKGASAIHMASLTKNTDGTREDRMRTDYIRHDPASLFCCDSWLGGIDHNLNEDTPPNGLNRKHGYPQIYFTFLRNVTDSVYASRIFPVVQTSINAARLLAKQGVVADLCYVDGSHEINDVYADLQAYWPLVRKGGVMFGDDLAFPGVMLDTNRFCIERGLKMTVESDNFWVITKP